MDVRILQGKSKRGKADYESKKNPEDRKYINNTHQGKTGKSGMKH
jgi:hypothetical protein